jgi:hypothetical protein
MADEGRSLKAQPTMDEDLRRQPFVIVLGQQGALEG